LAVFFWIQVGNKLLQSIGKRKEWYLSNQNVTRRRLPENAENLLFACVSGTPVNARLLRFFRKFKVSINTRTFIQVPELLVAHLCAYLGTVITVHTTHQAEKLESS